MAKNITKKNLKLDAYLKYHASQSHRKMNVLPGVIGDAELYSNNIIYRNARKMVLGFGYKFTFEPDFPYQTQSLLYLSEILATKTIPALDNLRCIRDLERSNPGQFRLNELFTFSPRGNYLLHETAHCLAYEMIDDSSTGSQRSPIWKLRLIKIMIGESFANSTEMVARQITTDPWISRQNFYAGDMIQDFDRYCPRFGLQSFFELSFALFLYSNFLCETLSQNEIDLVYEFAEIPAKARKDPLFRKVFSRLVPGALGLNSNFRVFTTSFFLKKSGFKKDITELCKFDPVEYLFEHRTVFNQAKLLCKTICQS